LTVVAVAKSQRLALAAFNAVTQAFPGSRAVLTGRSEEVLSEFTPSLATPLNAGARPQDLNPDLSVRQIEVLRHLLGGRSMKDTARRLNITARTVAFHKYRAMERNGLRNNADLISFADRHGLLSRDVQRLK
jgi:DNA-binding CsgD family transcriptional regulator